MYRKILVPVNGSHASEAGLRKGIELAHAHGARVRLIHVIDARMIAGSRRNFDGGVGLCDSLLTSGRAILDRARTFVQAQGIKVEGVFFRFANDYAANAIRADIARWRPDLVVVGTRNRSPLSRILHKSDAERVAREARVPVLIAHVEDDGG